MTQATVKPVIVVAGPTASGKSALALDVTRAFDGEIINADSMQVYRELRVLTARPEAAEEILVPHRLFGVLPVAEPCSAGRWLGMAAEAIRAARAAGRLPVVVGGTGLYLKALREGLAPVPGVPPAVLDEAKALYDKSGGEGFRGELARLDAEAAAWIKPGDRQRLLRAYAVARATGRTLAQWQAEADGTSPVPGPIRTLAVIPPREAIYAACDARFERMLEKGALSEAAALMAQGLAPGLPGMKAVGLRELMAHLRGEMTLSEAAEAAKTATRRYAKRQLTWLRHQVIADVTLDEQYSKRLTKKIFAIIRRFLLTP